MGEMADFSERAKSASRLDSAKLNRSWGQESVPLIRLAHAQLRRVVDPTFGSRQRSSLVHASEDVIEGHPGELLGLPVPRHHRIMGICPIRMVESSNDGAWTNVCQEPQREEFHTIPACFCKGPNVPN